MELRDRIGYDAGTTRLEDALVTAAEHAFHYLDFNADQGPNRLDNWDGSLVESVLATAQVNNLTLTLHTASSVNIAEFSPHVDEAVDRYLQGNIDLAQRLNLPRCSSPRRLPLQQRAGRTEDRFSGAAAAGNRVRRASRSNLAAGESKL